MFDFDRLETFVVVAATVLFVLGGSACSDDDQGNDSSNEPSQDAALDTTDSGQNGDSSDTHSDGDGGNLLEAGEECTCSSSLPGTMRCEACEGQWCYTPRRDFIEPSYCTQPCEDNSDCTSLGNGWNCDWNGYCVQE